MTERVHLGRRLRAERRFHFLGASAAFISLLALAVMLGAILVQATPALTRFNIRLDLMLEESVIDPLGQRDPMRLRANINGFQSLMEEALWSRMPDVADDRAARQDVRALFTRLAMRPLAEHVARHPELVGARVRALAPVSDDVDLYLKGVVSPEILWMLPGEIQATPLPLGESEQREWRVVARGNGQDGEGVFSPVLARIKAGLVREADSLTRDAQIADSARIDLETRRGRFQAEQTHLERLADAEVLAHAKALLEGSQRAEVARVGMGTMDADASLRFAYLAGGAFVSDALNGQLREELRVWTDARRHEAQAEAVALEARASRQYAEAERAERRNLTIHAVHKERAARAWLEVDRRLIVSDSLIAQGESIDRKDPAQLRLMAQLLAGRALAGAGDLFLPADNSMQLREAVTGFNLQETAYARAASARAAQEYAMLLRRVERLEAVGQRDRAEAVRQLGTDLNLRILRRNREARRFAQTAARIRLMDEAALQAEAESQLGFGLGGDEMLAYLLGAAEYGAKPNVEALRQFLRRRLQLDIDAVQQDIARMNRRAVEAANAARALRERAGASMRPETLDARQSSYLLEGPDGMVIRLQDVSAGAARGMAIIAPRVMAPDVGAPDVGAQSVGMIEGPAGAWRIRVVETPRVDRNVSDQEIAYAHALKADGVIRRGLNWGLLAHSDSTYPELAGVAAALMGAFLTMALTMVMSVPIGVMAAVYLEEFARRSAFTSFIELNINNLAAAPSILFGLLGAALFLNVFGLPRGAPIVGALVLSMMTLPTVIIASRAALRSVPDDVRTGALALGASRAQAVFHHVLPLAAPGVMTGAIIGISRALGETAPLLMIGMLAFVAEPPADIFDSSTVLPVLIYKWAGGAERAWLPMTAAAVVILLLFMFAMNGAAVYVRRRFEKKVM